MARQLVCDALDEHPRPHLRGIGDMLAPWLLTSFRSGAFARGGELVLEPSERSA
jgi:hypothetical protein